MKGDKSMSLMKSFIFGCAICLVTFCCFCPATVLAQTAKPAQAPQVDHDQTLQQLLREVRELRLVVQRATVNNTRFQMLIERLRIEQARFDAINRQLENLRAQLAELRASKPQMENQIKDAETMLDRTTDPKARAEWEFSIKAAKTNLTKMAAEEDRLADRETSLNAELQAAQAKLNDLNNQLDALMGELKGL
jgi:chromosome segregation ATPase